MCDRHSSEQPDGRRSDAEQSDADSSSTDLAGADLGGGWVRRIVPWCMNVKGEGMPSRESLSRLLANVWARVKTRSICCGDPGHAGC